MKILIVSGRYPWPPWTGDRLRASQLVELLAARHELLLLTPEPGPTAPPPPPDVPLTTYRPRSGRRRWVGAARAFLSGVPGQSGLYQDPALGRALRDLAPDHDLAVLLLARLGRHLPDVGELPVVLDLVDALSLSFANRARFDRPLLRPFWHLEASLLGRYERRLVAASSCATVVSDRDRSHLLERVGARGRIEVVPIVVEPAPVSSLPSRQDPPTLILSGNLGYFATVDSVTWWLREIWPSLRRRRPTLRMVLAGSRPSQALHRLARRAGVEVVAQPDDLRRLIAAAQVAVAPLRCGAGAPIKVLEAWSVGTPVVASSQAAAGVGEPFDDGLLVADSTDEWLGAVERLLDDEGLRHQLVLCGRQRLERSFSIQRVADRLEAVLAAAAQSR